MRYRRLRFLEVIQHDDEFMSREDGKWYPATRDRIGQQWCLMMPYRRPLKSEGAAKTNSGRAKCVVMRPVRLKQV